MSDQLTELTEELGKVYDTYKEHEVKLNGKKGKDSEPGLKKEFFREATQAQNSTLAEKTASVEATSWDEARSLVIRLNPTWKIYDEGITIGGNEKDIYTFILQENPEFKPFTFINKKTKRVWTKQVVETAPSLDDERLMREDPDLWKEVTDIPYADVIKNLLYESNVDRYEIDERLETLWDAYHGPRELKPLEELTSDQQARIQKYIFPGPPQVKLQAPRDAKPEELDDE